MSSSGELFDLLAMAYSSLHTDFSSADSSSAPQGVEAVVARARVAQAAFAHADQVLADAAAKGAAWAILEPERNRRLALAAVADTGLGNVEDKVTKNFRKTLGLLRDIDGMKTVGVIAEQPELGITQIARPVGVVAAITPSTNPGATPANNIINALKGRNAVIVAPSPKGSGTCALLVGFVREQLQRIGLPADLVQQLPSPASRADTARLMELADLVVATGSAANVRAAYASGTPALGVGAGNVVGIVLPQADVAGAAARIAASKTFDNATSCSSENAVIAVGGQGAALLAALAGEGGVLLDAEEKQRLENALFAEGKLASQWVGKSATEIAAGAGLDGERFGAARFLIVPEVGAGKAYPFSGEKLSPVLTFYAVADFAEALALTDRIYAYQGRGHSVGLHGATDAEALLAAQTLPVCRVIRDQIHCVAVGGAFDNGLPFSLSMGCGTWGGNGFSDNLNYRHFLNITRIVVPIPPREPTPEDLLADYWEKYGK